MEFTLSYCDKKDLRITKHLLSYTQDGFHLQFYATCVAPPKHEQSRLPPDSFTLVIAHGLGLRE